MQTLEEYVNSDFYPIDNPDSFDWRNLVDQCKSSLNKSGICILKKFVRNNIIEKMVYEADKSFHLSHSSKESHNVFFQDINSFPANHPLRKKEYTSINSIPYDYINSKDILHKLYNWDPLMDFLSPILGHRLYRMADPMAALTINCMNHGQNHGWHYDESQVTITLLIQEPIAGGIFQYVPNLRNIDCDNYLKLDAILNGDSDNVVTLDLDAGDLLIFAGYFSLHRVTPVEGDKTRYVGTLCYKDKPNIFNSPEVQQLFYGRINQG